MCSRIDVEYLRTSTVGVRILSKQCTCGRQIRRPAKASIYVCMHRRNCVSGNRIYKVLHVASASQADSLARLLASSSCTVLEDSRGHAASSLQLLPLRQMPSKYKRSASTRAGLVRALCLAKSSVVVCM